MFDVDWRVRSKHPYYNMMEFESNIQHQILNILAPIDKPPNTQNKSQFFNKLDTWRQQVANFDDESPEYVFP